VRHPRPEAKSRRRPGNQRGLARPTQPCRGHNRGEAPQHIAASSRRAARRDRRSGGAGPERSRAAASRTSRPAHAGPVARRRAPRPRARRRGGAQQRHRGSPSGDQVGRLTRSDVPGAPVRLRCGGDDLTAHRFASTTAGRLEGALALDAQRLSPDTKIARRPNRRPFASTPRLGGPLAAVRPRSGRCGIPLSDSGAEIPSTANSTCRVRVERLRWRREFCCSNARARSAESRPLHRTLLEAGVRSCSTTRALPDFQRRRTPEPCRGGALARSVASAGGLRGTVQAALTCSSTARHDLAPTPTTLTSRSRPRAGSTAGASCRRPGLADMVTLDVPGRSSGRAESHGARGSTHAAPRPAVVGAAGSVVLCCRGGMLARFPLRARDGVVGTRRVVTLRAGVEGGARFAAE